MWPPGEYQNAPGPAATAGSVPDACGVRAELPADVVFQQLAAPVADVERRGRQDEVGLVVAVLGLEERVGRAAGEVGLDRVDREIHAGEPPPGGVGLLAEDRDVPAVGRRRLRRSA